MAKKKGIIKKIIFGVLGAIGLFIIILFVNLKMFEHRSMIISKGKPIDNYGVHKAALIVIDVQEATTGEISTDKFYKSHADEFIAGINRIAEHFRQQNIPIVYVRSEISDLLLNLLNDSYAKGSIGARNDKRMKVLSDIDVPKSRSDAFANTELDRILTDKKVSELYIVGLDAAFCVNSTVAAAQNRHYKLNLIDEGILSKSVKMKDSMMLSFRGRGVNIIKLDSLKSL